MITAAVGGVAGLLGFLQRWPRRAAGGQRRAHELDEAGGHAHRVEQVERREHPAPGDAVLAGKQPQAETRDLEGELPAGAIVTRSGPQLRLNPLYDVLEVGLHHGQHPPSISTKASMRVRCCPRERSVQSPSRTSRGRPAFCKASRTAGSRTR